MAERLRRVVQHVLGLDLACGLASTRLAAGIAGRLAAPRGLLQVLPGYDARFLAPLHVRRLEGVDDRTAAALGRVGVQTIGDLRHTDPAVVQHAVGRSARVLMSLASGHDDRVLQPSSPWRWAQPGSAWASPCTRGSAAHAPGRDRAGGRRRAS
jgi:DNA polymerase-4